MGRSLLLGLGATAAMAALAICAPEALAAPQAVTIAVPPTCIVDEKGDMTDGKTRVTLDMCEITVPDGMTLYPAPPWSLDPGTTRVTWSGTSGVGARASATHSIIVMDATPPTLTPPAAVTLDTTGTSVVPTTEAEPAGRSIGKGDAIDVTTHKSEIDVTHDAAETLAIGKHTVVWTAADEASRKATATQIVTVVDAGEPTIKCPDPVRIKSSTPIAKSLVKDAFGTIPEDDLHDNHDTELDVANDANLDGGGTFPVGETKVTWTATDDAGNKGTCEQHVYVMEPRIERTLPSDAGADGERFGSSMVSAGGLLIVGNPHHSTATASKTGEVIAYKISDGTQKYRIQHPAPAANQNFGNALAILPGTSGTTLAVGVPGKGTNTGEVLLYDAATGAKKASTAQNPNTAASKADRFGESLAALGQDLLVGAPAYDAVGGYRDTGRAYVFAQSGSLRYEIANPEQTAFDRFGASLAAGNDGTSDRVYIGSAVHKETDEDTGLTTTTRGVVYIYDVTATTSTSTVPGHSTALSSPGTSDTDFGEAQIRPAPGGGVYVGEPTVTLSTGWTGKIRHHSHDGARLGSVDAPSCCEAAFGTAFDLDGRLLYAGNAEVYPKGHLTAFGPSTRSYLDSFVDTSIKPAGYYTIHFGFAVESLGDGRVAVAEYLEKGRLGKTRVHVLDLRTLAPTLVPPAPSGAAGSGESETRSQAQAPPPAQPTMSVRLAEPELVSTEHVSAGEIRLTYNVQLSPFEVDAMDYVMADAALEVVAVDVEGSAVVLTYVDASTGRAPAAGAAAPGVMLVGGIGYY